MTEQLTTSVPRQKDWFLSADAFGKLLAVLDEDSERAGEKYEAIRRRLVRLFEWRGCSGGEALADRTIDRVSRRIEEGEEIRASHPTVYFYGVARNVLKEYWSEERKEAKARQAIAPAQFAVVEDFRDIELAKRLECLDRCLARLPREGLELITRYYRSEKGAKIAERMEMARTLGITPGALRLRAHRIRRALETSVNERLNRRTDG